MTETTILHADCDAFFASVELRDRPELAGRPLIVGGGVVIAATYEARARGVHGGLGEVRARRLCPDAVWVAPRMEAYVAASREVHVLFAETASRVEPVSIEEAFLDVADRATARRPPEAIAAQLRRDARDRLGLPITVGVARSKVLAKMASRCAKPDGLLVLEPDREAGVLAPLAVGQLYGVGPRTASRLHAHGLRTVGDVARLAEHELIGVVGKPAARYLHAASHGRDLGPVQPPGPRRSYGAQRALPRGTRDRSTLDEVLDRVTQRASERMRRAGRAARTVHLHVRFDDFTRASRARTLVRATADPAALAAAARALLDASMPAIERGGATCIGVALANLDGVGSAHQLVLPLSDDAASRRAGRGLSAR